MSDNFHSFCLAVCTALFMVMFIIVLIFSARNTRFAIRYDYELESYRHKLQSLEDTYNEMREKLITERSPILPRYIEINTVYWEKVQKKWERMYYNY